MRKSRNSVPLLIAASIGVSLIWTLLTGQIWHWLPVGGAIAATLGLMKATRG